MSFILFFSDFSFLFIHFSSEEWNIELPIYKIVVI